MHQHFENKRFNSLTVNPEYTANDRELYGGGMLHE